MNIKSIIGLYINVHKCVPCIVACTCTWIVYCHGCDNIAQNIACASRVCFFLFFFFCYYSLELYVLVDCITGVPTMYTQYSVTV